MVIVNRDTTHSTTTTLVALMGLQDQMVMMEMQRSMVVETEMMALLSL